MRTQWTVNEVALLQARVDAGAALLDRRDPTWFRRIDKDRLDISACANCIMGQLGGLKVDEDGHVLGDWEEVAAGYGLHTKADLLAHGFTLISWDHWFATVRPWPLLTEMWVEAVEKRLANAGLLWAA